VHHKPPPITIHELYAHLSSILGECQASSLGAV